MIGQIDLAGSFTLPGSAMTLNRVGYGAMQLAGRDGNKLLWGEMLKQKSGNVVNIPASLV